MIILLLMIFVAASENSLSDLKLLRLHAEESLMETTNLDLHVKSLQRENL